MRLLSDRKRIFLPCLTTIITASALILTSCANTDKVVKTADLIFSEDAGQIVQNYKTVVCEIGDVVSTFSLSAGLYRNTEPIYAGGEEKGFISEIYPEKINGQSFNEGDPLIKIEYDNDRLSREHEKIKINIESYKNQVNADKAIRQDRIAEMTAGLAKMAYNEAEVQRLKVEKEKLSLEKYLFDADKHLAELSKNLEDAEEKLNGRIITAPYNGTINDFNNELNDEVKPDSKLMNISINDNSYISIGFDMQQITSGDEWRSFYSAFNKTQYNSNVLIEVNGETQKYPAHIISDSTVTNGRMRFLIELDEPYKDRFDLASHARTMVGIGMTVTEVPVIPKNVIRTEERAVENKQYVLILENNTVKKRYIQIGLSGDSTVEVISGVKPGDAIIQG